MPKLEIHRKKEPLREFFLADADFLTIGRTQSSDISLPDDNRRISRHHAVLVKFAVGTNGYFIRDLGSLLGTRVNGKPVYQWTLNDGDVIEISDYRLIYCATAEPRARLHRIKAVNKQTSKLSLDRSTYAMKLDVPSGFARFTDEQRELLEEFHQKAQQGMTLENSADDLMHAVAHAIHADRGFIGLFPTGDADIVEELGPINLGEQDEIEVSDIAFNAHLLEGITVHEDRTLLVPLRESKRTVGFICIDRNKSEECFREEDSQFLQAVSKLFSSRLTGESKRTPRPANLAPATEWPMQLVGSRERLAQFGKQIEIAASTDMNVMILGESGSGKELIARAVHQQCSNCGGPFVARNCSQTTETLSEAEIFGYVPNSGISGANPKGAPGWFELADGGTLFLDEVHRLDSPMQDKFLRVLQDKIVWRIGASSGRQLNIKVVAATDEDLERAVEEGWFRKPFYYRFGTKIHIPPLRERKEDVPLLAYFFLDAYAKKLGSKTRMLSHRALRMLMQYDWPGNIRQLENVIHTAVAKNQEIIFSWDLENQLVRRALDTTAEMPVEPAELTSVRTSKPIAVPRSMDEVEKEKIQEALESTLGNLTKAARILGYKSRQTILNKMDRYGIPRDYADPHFHE